jgi:hypothetical protein
MSNALLAEGGFLLPHLDSLRHPQFLPRRPREQRVGSRERDLAVRVLARQPEQSKHGTAHLYASAFRAGLRLGPDNALKLDSGDPITRARDRRCPYRRGS